MSIDPNNLPHSVETWLDDDGVSFVAVVNDGYGTELNRYVNLSVVELGEVVRENTKRFDKEGE